MQIVRWSGDGGNEAARRIRFRAGGQGGYGNAPQTSSPQQGGYGQAPAAAPQKHRQALTAAKCVMNSSSTAKSAQPPQQAAPQSFGSWG